MYLHEPTRGGTRGGKDQFTWKNVEVDKHRENYLANSLMAPVGRWQKGKDLTWYTKDSKVLGKKEKLKLEVEAIKKAEADAMARALGLKSGSSVKPVEKLSSEEIAEVCKRRNDDDEEVPPEEKMKGVGFKSSRSIFADSSSASVSKDGVTKFEQDALSGNKADRLVLHHSHKRTTSISSDKPKQKAAISKSSDTEQEVWVPAELTSAEKKRKDQDYDTPVKRKGKKHSKERVEKRKRRHSDRSEDKHKMTKRCKEQGSSSEARDHVHHHRHEKKRIHKSKRSKK